jgi:hypothetical protein
MPPQAGQLVLAATQRAAQAVEPVASHPEMQTAQALQAPPVAVPVARVGKAAVVLVAARQRLEVRA